MKLRSIIRKVKQIVLIKGGNKYMCNFYSFLTDKKGNRYAMGHDIRVKIRNGESDLREDSHASIAKLWKVSEDKCNKFEFNPLTKKLTLDTQNLPFNDSELINIDELMKEVKEAVPELIIKPIVNPFIDRKFNGEITDEIIELVKEWSSVYDSVGDSVYDSVWDSIGGASIRDSVVDSVWDSVRERDFVCDSVWDSIGDSVEAYISSFFNIKYNYDFSSAIKLWDMGLVPSFDGKVWRLNSYKGVVWEGKI
jgi:hypothetical protein